jgi:hypothetical protein
MAITVETIYNEALCLSSDGRVALAERLLESVESDPGLLEAQAAIAQQRIEELENGSAQPVPGPEGLKRVRESVRKRSQA